MRRVSIPPADLEARRLLWVMQRSARHYADGELVIRREDLVCRVFFCSGRIAWVHSGGRNGALLDVLERRTGLEREVASALINDCRATGQNFGEYLVDQGMVRGDQLHTCLHEHIVRQLDAVITETAGPVASLFLPIQRSYAGRYTFELSEVFDAVEDRPVVRTTGRGLATRLMQEASNMESVVGVALIATESRPITETMVNRRLDDGERRDVLAVLERRALAVELEHSALTEPGESLHWGERWMVYERLTETGLRLVVVSRPMSNLGSFLHGVRRAAGTLEAPESE